MSGTCVRIAATPVITEGFATALKMSGTGEKTSEIVWKIDATDGSKNLGHRGRLSCPGPYRKPVGGVRFFVACSNA
jgi:hypothetical protein